MSYFFKSTPEKLVIAIKEGNEDAATKYLKSLTPRDLNRAYGGGTPLHYAVEAQNGSMCQLLVKHCADMNHSTKAKFMEDFEFDYSLLGKTPLQFAREINNPEILRLLESHSKESSVEGLKAVSYPVKIPKVPNTVFGESENGNPEEKEISSASPEEYISDEVAIMSTIGSSMGTPMMGIPMGGSMGSPMGTLSDEGMSGMPNDRKRIKKLERQIKALKYRVRRLEARQKRSKENFYKTYPKRGRALVIGNGNFGKVQDYCHKDSEAIAFELKSLGFEVTSEKDLTVNQIRMKCHEFCLQDYTEYGMFLMFFSGHGIDGKIYGTGVDKRATLDVDTIFAYFQPNSAPTLAGKPKIFLWDCCRGQLGDDGNGTSKGFSTHYSPPCHADFLYGYASAPDFQAYVGCEDKTKGLSIWSYFLHKRLLGNDKRYHFADLLTLVQKDVLEFVNHSSDKRQSANHISYLTSFVEV